MKIQIKKPKISIINVNYNNVKFLTKNQLKTFCKKLI